MRIDTDQTTHGIVPPGFRLPASTTVGRVRLLVSDLTGSVSYYEHVLGLRAGRLPDGRVILTPRDGDRPLVELETRPGFRPAARRAPLGLYHFAILLPIDLRSWQILSHVRSIGISAGMSNHLVSEAIYLTDPDGLGIEVYADRPRSEWSYRDHQLTMATDPLDAKALLAAGEGKPWSGMPAGTVMGHVHLHVADLTAAEAFYHAGLGFDKVVWSYPGALFLSAGGYHHHLGTTRGPRTCRPPTTRRACCRGTSRFRPSTPPKPRPGASRRPAIQSNARATFGSPRIRGARPCALSPAEPEP